MFKQWLTRGITALGLLGVLTLSAQAGYPEFSGVQSRVGDASPGALASSINNYTYQDEQINILPTDGLIKVLRTNQKVLVNDYVVRVFPLNQVPRRELRNVMRQVTALEGGRAEVFQDKEGTGQQYLQVMAPKFMMPYIADAVAALDVPWLREYDDGATDAYYKALHIAAADVDLIAANYAGTEGFTTIDTTNNSIRIFDEAYRVEKYLDAAAAVDAPCNRVELEIKIYEVAASNDSKIGLDYVNWSNGPGRNLWSISKSGYSAEQRAEDLTSIFDPFLEGLAPVAPTASDDKELVLDIAANEGQRAVNYLLPSSFVDFLSAKGKAQVVSSSKLLLCSAVTGTLAHDTQVLAFVNNANSNTEETIEDVLSPQIIIKSNDVPQTQSQPDNGQGGDQIVFPGQAPEAIAVEDSGRRVNYANAGSTGIFMEVTPYVGLESMELDLSIDVREANGVAPSGLPIINSRSLATSVRLLDGQPYVVAGISQTNDSKQSGKAPILGSLPIVGYVFGGETDIKRQTDMVITITPRFILGDQVNIVTPPRVKTLELIVNGDAPQGAPGLEFGFDQWLIDG